MVSNLKADLKFELFEYKYKMVANSEEQDRLYKHNIDLAKLIGKLQYRLETEFND